MKSDQQIEKIKLYLDESGDEELIEAILGLVADHRKSSVSEPKPHYSKRSELFAEMFQLDPSERAVLAQQLLESLDQQELEQEWFDLAERRSAELESGEVKPLSWKEIRDQVSHGS